MLCIKLCMMYQCMCIKLCMMYQCVYDVQVCMYIVCIDKHFVCPICVCIIVFDSSIVCVCVCALALFCCLRLLLWSVTTRAASFWCPSPTCTPVCFSFGPSAPLWSSTAPLPSPTAAQYCQCSPAPVWRCHWLPSCSPSKL